MTDSTLDLSCRGGDSAYDFSITPPTIMGVTTSSTGGSKKRKQVVPSRLNHNTSDALAALKYNDVVVTHHEQPDKIQNSFSAKSSTIINGSDNSSRNSSISTTPQVANAASTAAILVPVSGTNDEEEELPPQKIFCSEKLFKMEAAETKISEEEKLLPPKIFELNNNNHNPHHQMNISEFMPPNFNWTTMFSSAAAAMSNPFYNLYMGAGNKEEDTTATSCAQPKFPHLSQFPFMGCGGNGTGGNMMFDMSPFMSNSFQQQQHLSPSQLPPPPSRIFNPEAFCELCNKEFCNKYFLKTHKANKHGVFDMASLNNFYANNMNLFAPPPQFISNPDITNTPSKDLPVSLLLLPSDNEELKEINQINNNGSQEEVSKDVADTLTEENISQTPLEKDGVSPNVTADAVTLISSFDTNQNNVSPGLPAENTDSNIATVTQTASILTISEKTDLSPLLTFVTDHDQQNGYLETNETADLPTNIPNLETIKNSMTTFLSVVEEPPSESFIIGPKSAVALQMSPKSQSSSRNLSASPSPAAGYLYNMGNEETSFMVGPGGGGSCESYCEICKKEFCNKYFLKKHKKNIHGINNIVRCGGGESSDKMAAIAAVTLFPTSTSTIINAKNAGTRSNSSCSPPHTNSYAGDDKVIVVRNSQNPTPERNFLPSCLSQNTIISDSSPPKTPANNIITPTPSNKNNKKYYSCLICRKEFNNMHFLGSHMFNVHNEPFETGFYNTLQQQHNKQESDEGREEDFQNSGSVHHHRDCSADKSEIMAAGANSSSVDETSQISNYNNGKGSSTNNNCKSRTSTTARRRIPPNRPTFYQKKHRFYGGGGGGGASSSSDYFYTREKGAAGLHHHHHHHHSSYYRDVMLYKQQQSQQRQSHPHPYGGTGNGKEYFFRQHGHHPSSSYNVSYCQVCQKELCNKYFLKTHMIKMHGISPEEAKRMLRKQSNNNNTTIHRPGPPGRGYNSSNNENYSNKKGDKIIPPPPPPPKICNKNDLRRAPSIVGKDKGGSHISGGFVLADSEEDTTCSVKKTTTTHHNKNSNNNNANNLSLFKENFTAENNISLDTASTAAMDYERELFEPYYRYLCSNETRRNHFSNPHIEALNSNNNFIPPSSQQQQHHHHLYPPPHIFDAKSKQLHVTHKDLSNPNQELNNIPPPLNVVQVQHQHNPYNNNNNCPLPPPPFNYPGVPFPGVAAVAAAAYHNYPFAASSLIDPRYFGLLAPYGGSVLDNNGSTATAPTTRSIACPLCGLLNDDIRAFMAHMQIEHSSSGGPIAAEQGEKMSCYSSKMESFLKQQQQQVVKKENTRCSILPCSSPLINNPLNNNIQLSSNYSPPPKMSLYKKNCRKNLPQHPEESSLVEDKYMQQYTSFYYRRGMLPKFEKDKNNLNIDSGIFNGSRLYNDNDDDKYKCHECSRTFTYKETLKLHLRSHRRYLSQKYYRPTSSTSLLGSSHKMAAGRENYYQQEEEDLWGICSKNTSTLSSHRFFNRRKKLMIFGSGKRGGTQNYSTTINTNNNKDRHYNTNPSKACSGISSNKLTSSSPVIISPLKTMHSSNNDSNKSTYYTSPINKNHVQPTPTTTISYKTTFNGTPPSPIITSSSSPHALSSIYDKLPKHGTQSFISNSYVVNSDQKHEPEDYTLHIPSEKQNGTPFGLMMSSPTTHSESTKLESGTNQQTLPIPISNNVDRNMIMQPFILSRSLSNDAINQKDTTSFSKGLPPLLNGYITDSTDNTTTSLDNNNNNFSFLPSLIYIPVFEEIKEKIVGRFILEPYPIVDPQEGTYNMAANTI